MPTVAAATEAASAKALVAMSGWLLDICIGISLSSLAVWPSFTDRLVERFGAELFDAGAVMGSF